MSWINIPKILSYDRVFNGILSDRTAGKTYGTIKFLYENFIETGNKFVVIKRYDKNIVNMVGWGKKVALEQFPDRKIIVKNKKIIEIDNEFAGIIIPLSTSLSLKDNDFSANTEFMFFDEFVIMDNNLFSYIPNEGFIFSELYHTIDRGKDFLRAILCGNKIIKSNPILDFLNIKFDPKKEYNFGRDYVVYCSSDKNRENKITNTRWGRLTEKNSIYNSYISGEDFLINNDEIIVDRKKMSFMFNIVFDNLTKLSVWYYKDNLYISNEYINGEVGYCFYSIYSDIKTTLITKEIKNIIINSLKSGNIRYENELCVKIISEYFR